MESYQEPCPGTAARENTAAILAAREAALRELLDTVEYEARLMDASLGEAHEIAVGICRIVKSSVFGGGGPLDLPAYRDNCRKFDAARIDENDLYEVYADDLERHQKRQRKDLTVSDSDADKFTVVKRRRGYLSSLAALQAQAADILGLLGALDVPAR
jgi:hypothetical protein